MAAVTIPVAALAYAERGWHVFPVDRLKHPLVEHGFKDATTDPATIREWWSRWPWAGVAIATGAVSRVDVIDLDAGHTSGVDGRATAKASGLHLPVTPIAITQHGGEHRYHLHPGRPVKSRAPVAPDLLGIDVRGDGGYVVAPPSPGYRWADGLSPWDVDLAPAPEWLLRLAAPEPATGDGAARPANYWRALAAGPVPEGQRNDALARLAGHLLRRHVDPYLTLTLAQAWARTACTPPLDPAEVARTVENIATAEARRRGVSI